MMMLMLVDKRYELLKHRIEPHPGAIVAFSGGTDSALLLAAARDALAGDLTAVTWQTEVTPDSDIDQAVRLAEQLDVSHRVICASFLEIEAAAANNTDRCYHCRRQMYSDMMKVATGSNVVAILEGVNVDDLSDTRPGLEAAREMGIVHPLLEAGLDKQAVRELARALGLPNWDREAAPCLASRIAFGRRVTSSRLMRINRGETFLRERGFRNVRLRLLDDIEARIEVAPEQVPALHADWSAVNSFLCDLDFARIEIASTGYKMGSMNSEVASREVASSPRNQAPRNDVERFDGVERENG